MEGLLEPFFCGRFRAEPVVVHDPRSGEVVYLPPDHQDVGPLMEDLVAFVGSNRDILDPLIVAGIFHKHFVIMHPFPDGNGRTARLATTLLLASMGVDLFPLLSFEAYLSRDVSRYFATVGLSGGYYDVQGQIDFTEWLEYFADGILDKLLRVEREIQEVEAHERTPDTALRAHDRLILEHIRQHGFLTDRDYARLTERAKATRALDLRRLVELGLIERHGKGRATYYKLP